MGSPVKWILTWAETGPVDKLGKEPSTQLIESTLSLSFSSPKFKLSKSAKLIASFVLATASAVTLWVVITGLASLYASACDSTFK